MATQSHVRGLQRIWVPEHSLWVFVWCADDGDLDRNHRLAYACCSTIAEFYPQQGQYVLVKKPSSTYNYVYGVPYAIETVNGAVKVHYTDLTPALGRARWTSDSVSSAGTPMNRDAGAHGTCLEGQFAQEDLSATGPILWNAKAHGVHNQPLPVLELSDIASVITAYGGGGVGGATLNQYGAPTGCLGIEYTRDTRARIQTNSDGSEQIAEIDSAFEDAQVATRGTRGSTAQHYKVGYLALSFRENLFGIGLHGWVAGATDAANPYQPGSLGYASNTAGGGGTSGPWGGSTDTLASAGITLNSQARIDTWHHRRPPRDSSNNQTDGCQLVTIRIYDLWVSSLVFNRYTFRRYPSVDRFGFVFALSAETLLGTEVISGSGDASGGF